MIQSVPAGRLREGDPPDPSELSVNMQPRGQWCLGTQAEVNRALLSASAFLVVFALGILLACPSSFAQSRKSKVPVINKLGGVQHLAFSGIVSSLDMKLKILSVERARNAGVDIFPFNRTARIEDAGGKKLGLKALRPGTSILIYYDEKAGERKVTQIVVLGADKGRIKKAIHSPS